MLEESSLTPAEQQAVADFAGKIDITNTNMVLQYGAGAQQKMADFSESALKNVRTKDLGEVGEMLSDLVTELKGFSADAEDDKKGFLGIFKKASNKIASLQANYSKAETNVDKICTALESHQVQLFKDIAMLDEMYQKNLLNHKELSMYILAGRKKLDQMRNEVLPQMIEKAKRTGAPEDSQAANDMAAMCNQIGRAHV